MGFPTLHRIKDRLVISNIDKTKGNCIVITFLFLFSQIKLLHFNLSIDLIQEMRKMVKKQFNPADFRLKQEKKINQGRKPGFIYDVVLDDEFLTDVIKNASTACVLDYLEGNQYLGLMYPSQLCIGIACNLLLFKLLNLPTIWAYEPFTGMYVYYFALTSESNFNSLKSLQVEGIMRVYTDYALAFDKYNMPKFSPNWADYKLSNLPQLTPQTLEIIEETAKNVIENKNNFFLINNLKPLYNIPLALSAKLGKTVISINTHILLEHLLQAMTHSSAVIDNTYSDVYLVDYPQFCKGLTFQGKHKRKDVVINQALKELQNHAIIDDFKIIDDKLTFKSALITKHIKQRIRRNMGFYAQLPPTKQAPIIATFINYLAWIVNCPSNFAQLTIALDTLLTQLGVERLLKEHRLSEIAKLLNLLRSYGVEYGLLAMPAEQKEITSKDVKYLLQNRGKLHEFFVLHNPQTGKEKK